MTTADVESLGNDVLEELPEDPEQAKQIAGKSPTKIALERLRHDKVAIACSTIVVFLVLCAVLAPVICDFWPWGKLSTQPGNPGKYIVEGLPIIGPPLHGFIPQHPLGLNPNDASDNLAQLLYGLRTDLAIGLLATIFSMVIGIILGLIAGFSRGIGDRIITFIVDVMLCFPFLIGAISLAPIITSHFAGNASLLTEVQIGSLIGILTIFGWMGLTRLIRGYVISLREREFIQAAQVIGVPTRRILFRELLPNMAGPIIVSLSLTLPAYVSIEAGLSFLGLGITGAPDLGLTIDLAQDYYQSYPIYLYAPVLTLVVLVLALNLLGDSVRDAFDPQTRR